MRSAVGLDSGLIFYMIIGMEKRLNPEPYEGMRIVDPAFPDDIWEVVQYDGAFASSIYIRRERDGRLWHHSHESWKYAWDRGYLVNPPADRKTSS